MAKKYPGFKDFLCLPQPAKSLLNKSWTCVAIIISDSLVIKNLLSVAIWSVWNNVNEENGWLIVN